MTIDTSSQRRQAAAGVALIGIAVATGVSTLVLQDTGDLQPRTEPAPLTPESKAAVVPRQLPKPAFGLEDADDLGADLVEPILQPESVKPAVPRRVITQPIAETPAGEATRQREEPLAIPALPEPELTQASAPTTRVITETSFDLAPANAVEGGYADGEGVQFDDDGTGNITSSPEPVLSEPLGPGEPGTMAYPGEDRPDLSGGPVQWQAYTSVSVDTVEASPVPLVAADPVAGSLDDQETLEFSQHYPIIVADGVKVGAVPLRADEAGSSLHLGSFLALFEASMDPALYARLASSRAADTYVDLNTLTTAGLQIEYNAAEEKIVLGVN